MKIDICDIGYNDLYAIKLYKGENLVWERRLIDYLEYDMVFRWDSRYYSTAGAQTSNGAYGSLDNARSAVNLCVRQGTKDRYSLESWLEAKPSFISKCYLNKFLEKHKLNSITSLANAFKGFQYVYGGFYRDTNNEHLREVIQFRIPETCTNMSSTFSTCVNLTRVNLCGDVSNVTTFASLFSGCSELKEVIITGWNIKSTASVSSMFSGCSKLENIYLLECDETTIEKITSAKPSQASIITTI